MRKLLIFAVLISFLISQVSSDEEYDNKSNAKSNNKCYEIARSLYQKPFGEILSIPFIWLGKLTDNEKNKIDSSNQQKLQDSDQRKKLSLTNWSQLSLNYFTSNAKHDIDMVTGASKDVYKIDTQGKFGLKYQHEFTGKISEKFSYDIKEDIFYSEKSHERRNSFFTNDLQLRLYYQHESTYLKLQFNNRYYNSNETFFLNLPGVTYDTQQQLISGATLHLKQDFRKLNLNVYANLRNLEYDYLVPDDDEYEAYNASDNDFYTTAKLSFKITDHLNIFSTAYHKNDLNESNLFDHMNLGGGFEYNNKISLFSSIKAKVQYYNIVSDNINNEQDQNLVTQLRYTKRFRNGLSGFISYINRSCYDNETAQVYRVSNMLRVHTMYSYSIEHINNSYLLAGIKYNPENDGTLGFIEQNQYLLKNIYSTANIKYSLDLFTSYSLKFEYFLNPLQSFWIKDEYTDFYNIHKQNLLYIGSTLIF
ncbi:MAG: hypothetical protein PF570_05385 [Candidatus Cloacimonetes bacterium]|jgi:hypothetical protein|nr:hypothetical protein [Candidatus Cloacimonadota bacterium]